MPETPTKNKKVLIVDDDQFLLGMYAMKFKNGGFEVDTARSGQEVLNKLHDGASPDIVLLDMVLPVLSGIDILEKIRQEKYLPKAKIVILSNQNQSADIDHAKNLGIDGYIVKANATPSEVVGEVLRILGV